MKTLVYLLLCSSLVLAGCHKDKRPHPLRQTVVAFTFKEGSYWIYYDSVTGLVDSMFADRLAEWSNIKEWRIDNRFVYAAIDNNNKKYFSNYQFELNYEGLFFPLYYKYVRLYSLPLVNYPLRTGVYATMGASDTVWMDNLHASVDIARHTFDDVFSVRYHCTGIPSDRLQNNSLFYFKEGVGIVKMKISIHDSAKGAFFERNCNLIRYHIVL